MCVAGDLRVSPVEIMWQRFMELRLPSDVRDVRRWALCTCAPETIILVICGDFPSVYQKRTLSSTTLPVVFFFFFFCK